jgi:hypothetical protein
MCQEVFSRCSIRHIYEWRRSFRRLCNNVRNIPRASTYIGRFIFSGNPLCGCFYLIFGIITMSIPAKYSNRNIYLNILYQIRFGRYKVRIVRIYSLTCRNKLRYDIEYDGMAISLSNICFPLTPVVKAVSFL